jgi:hypothetical protein
MGSRPVSIFHPGQSPGLTEKIRMFKLIFTGILIYVAYLLFFRKKKTIGPGQENNDDDIHYTDYEEID